MCSEGLQSGALAMPKNQLSSKERKQLVAAARRVLRHAYAPYSRFRVGAALLTTKGELFVGCNVENASYGITNCAERTAIFSAIAHSGRLEIRAIAVVNDQGIACSPCGACRQAIYEFGPEALVLFPTESGWKEASIRQLLPEGFRFRE
jgi:cytidine deaminase